MNYLNNNIKLFYCIIYCNRWSTLTLFLNIYVFYFTSVIMDIVHKKNYFGKLVLNELLDFMENNNINEGASICLYSNSHRSIWENAYTISVISEQDLKRLKKFSIYEFCPVSSLIVVLHRLGKQALAKRSILPSVQIKKYF